MSPGTRPDLGPRAQGPGPRAAPTDTHVPGTGRKGHKSGESCCRHSNRATIRARRAQIDGRMAAFEGSSSIMQNTSRLSATHRAAAARGALVVVVANEIDISTELAAKLRDTNQTCLLACLLACLSPPEARQWTRAQLSSARHAGTGCHGNCVCKRSTSSNKSPTKSRRTSRKGRQAALLADTAYRHAYPTPCPALQSRRRAFLSSQSRCKIIFSSPSLTCCIYYSRALLFLVVLSLP